MRAHVKKPAKTILIYGLTDRQMAELTAAGAKENIICRRVTPEQAGLTVVQLLGENTLPAGETPASPVEGQYALLDGFEGREERGIALINAVAPGVIKAIRTRHNSSWSFAALCAEMQKEHAAMNPGQQR